MLGRLVVLFVSVLAFASSALADDLPTRSPPPPVDAPTPPPPEPEPSLPPPAATATPEATSPPTTPAPDPSAPQQQPAPPGPLPPPTKPTPVATGATIVTGRVTDVLSRSVPDVRVYVVPRRGKLQRTRTNKNGRYQVEVPRPGTYGVVIGIGIAHTYRTVIASRA